MFFIGLISLTTGEMVPVLVRTMKSANGLGIMFLQFADM